jgi:hypothetical protein
MATTCNAKYILNDCTCLTNPLDYYSNICGYVNKQNGLVYPCDPGCCLNACEATLPDILFKVETRPSAGVSLPQGYGYFIPQSDEPEYTQNATDIDTPTTSYQVPASPAASEDSGYKVWQLFLIALIPLFLVLILACFLT